MDLFGKHTQFYFGIDESVAAAPVTPDKVEIAPATPPTEPVSQTPETPPTSTPAPQANALADSLRAMGFSVPQGADDMAARLAVVRQQEQLRQQAQAYQQVMPHWSEFQKWQQAQQAEAQKAKASSWNAPEWNPEWRHQIRRDDAGNFVPAPGAPADIVQKYQAWQQHTTNLFDKLSANPADFMMKEAGLEQRLQQMIDARQQENFARWQADEKAKQIEAQIAPWVYQRDINGALVIDQMTGQPMYSQHGEAYVRALHEAKAAGINDPAKRDSYAKGQLAISLLTQQNTQQAQTQSIANQNDQSKQAFLQQAAQSAAPRAANQTPPAQPVGPGPTGLVELMKSNFRKNGYADLSLPPVGR